MGLVRRHGTNVAAEARWPERLRACAMFLALSAIAHLAWEILQLPLYTIWSNGTRGEVAFAVLHCTAGDVILAALFLTMAIVVGRCWSWPNGDWGVLAGLTMLAGVAFTAYSEWLNVYVLKAWSYSAAMPLVHVGSIDIGLSPLLQWIVVPCIVFTVLKLHRCGQQLRIALGK